MVEIKDENEINISNEIKNNINIEFTNLQGNEMKKTKYTVVKSHTRKVGKKKIKVRAHLRKNK